MSSLNVFDELERVQQELVNANARITALTAINEEQALKAKAEIARLENIIKIQQKQIERLMDARDVEAAAKYVATKRAAALVAGMSRTRRTIREELDRITKLLKDDSLFT